MRDRGMFLYDFPKSPSHSEIADLHHITKSQISMYNLDTLYHTPTGKAESLELTFEMAYTMPLL